MTVPSSTEIPVKHLRLRFRSDGKAMAWDAHPSYRKGLAQMPTTKAVDVCFLTDDGAAFLEVTNYGPGKVPTAALIEELASKVRDTLASMIWACSRKLDGKDFDSFTARFVRAAGTRELNVIAWIDADRPIDAADAGFFVSELEMRLRSWCVARVWITNRRIQDDPEHRVPWFEHALASRRG